MKYKNIIRTAVLFVAFIFLLSAASQANAKIKSIKFSGKEVKIGIGESQKLTVTVKPKSQKSKIKYASCNKKVLTISKKGKIKGKKKGTTHVIVRATDGSKKQAKIKVRVIQKVKSVSFINDLNNSTYQTNTTFTIQAAVLPKTASNKKLKWSSSSSGIASVSSNGTVTTKSKGSTTITAKATDGSNKKVSVQLKVVVPVNKITLAGGKDSINLQKGTEVKVSSTVEPSNASVSSLTWTSSDPSVATVSTTGYVTGKKNGLTVITATAKDGTNIQASVVVNVLSLSLKDVNYIAHRGLSSDAPENTLAAFKLAAEYGYWGIECDIWETKDERFVISHDSKLSRMCGVDKEIPDMDLEEIKSYKVIAGNGREQYPDETIPTLEEYLRVIAANDVHAVIELKMPELSEEAANRLLTLLDQAGVRGRTTFISFYTEPLEAIQKADNQHLVELQYITYSATDAVVQECLEKGYDLSCKYTGITKDAINQLHDEDRKVSVWTVDDFYMAYEMIHDLKVDYLTSNTMLFE